MNISRRFGPLSDRKNIMPSRGVCRCLFGPPDHEEIKKKLKKETEALYEKQKLDYNFDFISETPLPGNGRYSWEKVTRNDEVPKAYDMPGLAIANTCHERLQGEEISGQRDQTTAGVTLPSAVTVSSACWGSDENIDLERARSETPQPNSSQNKPYGASSPNAGSRGVKRKLCQREITDFFPQRKKVSHSKSASTSQQL